MCECTNEAPTMLLRAASAFWMLVAKVTSQAYCVPDVFAARYAGGELFSNAGISIAICASADAVLPTCFEPTTVSNIISVVRELQKSGTSPPTEPGTSPTEPVILGDFPLADDFLERIEPAVGSDFGCPDLPLEEPGLEPPVEKPTNDG